MKKLLIAMVLTLAFFAPVPVNATVGPLIGELAVVVDGETFYVWGVFMDYSTSRFRMRDMAYILNGTPAQFNIRETDDNRFDYWIVRGEQYVPTGNELKPIDALYCHYCCGSFADPFWFCGDFYFISAVVGVDGEDAPHTAIMLTAAECHEGEFFICIFEFARLLGFSVDWNQSYFWLMIFDFYIEDADYVISTTGEHSVLHNKPIEFLQLMLNLSGHWVDAIHFESTTIDESVAWPVELHFNERGQGVRSFGWNTLVPLRRGTLYWYPVSIQEIDGGYAEIMITDRRRIVVDMSGLTNELTYYIDNVPHHMIRRTEYTARRLFYQVDPIEGGGVRLRYLLGRTFGAGEGFTIYRSQVPGGRGVPIFSQLRVERHHDREFIDPWRYHNQVLFEFIDTDVSYGVHYYTFYTNPWRNYSVIEYGGVPWQIRVDLGEPPLYEVIESKELDETDENEMPIIYETEEDATASGRSRFWVWPLALLIAAIAAWIRFK